MLDSQEPAFDQPSSLMVKVKALLETDGRTPLEIHTQSGIPYHWLRKFMQGGYQNPSVNRIQYLYTFLSGKELEL